MWLCAAQGSSDAEQASKECRVGLRKMVSWNNMKYCGAIRSCVSVYEQMSDEASGRRLQEEEETIQDFSSTLSILFAKYLVNH